MAVVFVEDERWNFLPCFTTSGNGKKQQEDSQQQNPPEFLAERFIAEVWFLALMNES